MNPKFAYFIPNIFTALNMGCGFSAITLAVKGQFYYACLFIVVGSIFDMFDGRVARLTGTQSQFGEQFDSLSDLVSFGLAPALIFYYRFLVDYNRVGIVTSFIFVLCGALRLARFNTNIKSIPSDYFQGLPIPAAALALISATWFSVEFAYLDEIRFLAIAYILIYSFLMISNIPFNSFKNIGAFKSNKKLALLVLLILIYSVVIYEELMLFIIISLYTFLSLSLFIKNRSQYKSLQIIGASETDQEAGEKP